MAGQRLPQPRRRLRGSERGELRPARGQRGRLARLCQRQCRPRQREPCPRPSCELEREIGESGRAPAGAVRRESCNRAEEDAEMLVSTAVQHRNISASLKQRGYYMERSTEHFWAGKDPLQSTSRKGRSLFLLMRKICQVGSELNNYPNNY